MDLLTKSFSTKIVIIFTALLISACGGRDTQSPTTSATASTADLQTLADNVAAQPLTLYALFWGYNRLNVINLHQYHSKLW